MGPHGNNAYASLSFQAGSENQDSTGLLGHDSVGLIPTLAPGVEYLRRGPVLNSNVFFFSDKKDARVKNPATSLEETVSETDIIEASLVSWKPTNDEDKKRWSRLRKLGASTSRMRGDLLFGSQISVYCNNPKDKHEVADLYFEIFKSMLRPYYPDLQ